MLREENYTFLVYYLIIDIIINLIIDEASILCVELEGIGSIQFGTQKEVPITTTLKAESPQIFTTNVVYS